MWKVQIEINLTVTDDEYTGEGEEIQVQIAESIPEGFQNLDKWEGDVRKIGFQAMREMFRCGIELFEKKLLSEYVHKDEECHTVKRGKLNFTRGGLLKGPQQSMTKVVALCTEKKAVYFKACPALRTKNCVG